ncbi:protein FAM131C isoform X2 [Scyliorhinus canicula]|uniref:protein FAM131C isoform X2 n=1 Tax=Scyliorhinus canicula TaxID=7830 RepID=UPI0018F2C81D|nr:protein FAM131C isoform X2 [Scyliorhinus canicula]
MIDAEILTNNCENRSKASDVPQVPVSQEKRESPQKAEDHEVCKQDRMDFCWDPIIQNCFGSSNVIFSGSKQTLNGYDITALARSSLVGLVQTVKDHITKPTAMARGRVAHLIEWKGWGAHGRGCNTYPMDEAHYFSLTDELKEARFAAGVAEQFAITEATLSAWSSPDAEEVVGGSSLSNTIDYLNTDEMYLEDQSPSGSQTFYPSSVEGPCTVLAPVSSYGASLSGEPVQTDMTIVQPSHNGSLAETFLTCDPPNCLSLPETTSGGAELHRTVRQSTGSHPHHSRSSNSSSLMEDDVFYN